MPPKQLTEAVERPVGSTAYDHVRFLLDNLTAAPLKPAVVESEPDPRHPGRTAYRITGETRAAVQHAIDDLMAIAHRHHGHGLASFTNPAPNCDHGFISLGAMVLR